MKFFRKWLLNSLRKANAEENHHDQDEPDYDKASTAYYPLSSNNISSRKTRRGQDVCGDNGMDLPEGGLNIQVKGAIGGKIVIFRSYDERNDRNCYSTYLIPDDENFQESLGKIITMESLKL